MKPNREFHRVIDLRDRVAARETVDAILLKRVDVLLRQRVKRKRKLQPL